MVKNDTRPPEPGPGYIYLLINNSMPGLVKVGRTTRSPLERMGELSSATGVPTPFQLVYDVLVPDAVAAEQFVHDALTKQGYRATENREFFRAPIHEVVKLLMRVRELMESITIERSLSGETRIALEEGFSAQDEDALDELLESAAAICTETGQASISMIQRRLRIGYPSAARIIEQLEKLGIIGPAEGSTPRKVLLSKSDAEKRLRLAQAGKVIK